MNRILLILLLPLSAIAQTTYPVLSTTTARTIVGGVTNLPHLNSNNVFTGTGRWTGAVTLTNSGNVFAGDGSGLTGISAGISSSGGSATNLTIRQNAGNALTVNTNVLIVATNYVRASGDGGLTVSNATFGSGEKGLSVFDGFYQFNIGYGSRADYGPNANGFSIYRAASSTYLDQTTGPFYFQIGSSTYVSFKTTGIEATNASITNIVASTVVVNGGATVTGILSATASLNFDLTALTVEDKTMTVTGAAVGDVVTLGVPNGSVTTSVQYTAWVSAADTVTVRARTSATGEDPASGTFRATVIKH